MACTDRSRVEAIRSSNLFEARLAKYNAGLFGPWTITTALKSFVHIFTVRSVFDGAPASTALHPLFIVTSTIPFAPLLSALLCLYGTFEMVSTGVALHKSVRDFREFESVVVRHQKDHEAYVTCVRNLRMHEKSLGTDQQQLGAGDAPIVSPQATPQQTAAYAEVESAASDRRKALHNLMRSAWTGTRDVLFQGGGIGCNIAMLLSRGSDFLKIAALPVNTLCTAICGGAFNVACGVLHIITGVLGMRDARAKHSAAARTGAHITTQLDALEGSVARSGATVSDAQREAFEVTRSLLSHAKKNEKEAKRQARQELRVGKWRIAYGSCSIVFGIGATAFFLLAGTLTTGGLAIVVAASLAFTLWGAYAFHRSVDNAKRLDAQNRDPSDAGSALPDGNDGLLPLDGALDRAVRLLDRFRNTDHEARKTIKRAMVDLGLSRKDLWPLRFHGEDPALRPPLQEILKIKLRNLVAGDGARQGAPGA